MVTRNDLCISIQKIYFAWWYVNGKDGGQHSVILTAVRALPSLTFHVLRVRHMMRMYIPTCKTLLFLMHIQRINMSLGHEQSLISMYIITLIVGSCNSYLTTSQHWTCQLKYKYHRTTASNFLTFPVLLLNTYHKLHGYKIEWQFPGMSFIVVTLTGFKGLTKIILLRIMITLLPSKHSSTELPLMVGSYALCELIPHLHSTYEPHP